MHDGATPYAGVDGASAIPDVNQLPLEVLLDAEDSVLSDALRRLVRHLDRSAENYAAHSSST